MIRTVCVHELDKALQKSINLSLRELKAKIALTIDFKPIRTRHCIATPGPPVGRQKVNPFSHDR